jgi:hypothetical protein
LSRHLGSRDVGRAIINTRRKVMNAYLGEVVPYQCPNVGLSAVGVRRLVALVVDHFGTVEKVAAAESLQQIVGVSFDTAVALVAAECSDRECGRQLDRVISKLLVSA